MAIWNFSWFLFFLFLKPRDKKFFNIEILFLSNEMYDIPLLQISEFSSEFLKTKVHVKMIQPSGFINFLIYFLNVIILFFSLLSMFFRFVRVPSIRAIQHSGRLHLFCLIRAVTPLNLLFNSSLIYYKFFEIFWICG